MKGNGKENIRKKKEGLQTEVEEKRRRERPPWRKERRIKEKVKEERGKENERKRKK